MIRPDERRVDHELCPVTVVRFRVERGKSDKSIIDTGMSPVSIAEVSGDYPVERGDGFIASVKKDAPTGQEGLYMFRTVACVALWLFLALVAITPAMAQEDLAKESQNPIGNLISLPFENNTSFGVGPEDAFVYVLNLKPVYPVNLGKWNLISLGILPVIYQEERMVPKLMICG